MAFQAGRTAFFSYNDGSARDLSSFIDSCDLEKRVTLPETSTFGSTSVRRQVVALMDNSFTLSGNYDPTATTGPDAVLASDFGNATARTIIYGPYGSTGGYVRYTGTARIQDYRVSSPVDGKVTWSATLVMDGTLTRDTF